MTNVVFIHTDDTGQYIEPYGYNVPTPHLQEMSEESILFRQATCAGPTCSPSRGALMTGQSPHSNGLTGLTHRGFAINDYSQHLVRFLSRNGYETALCGQQHEVKGETRKQAAREKLGYEVFPDDPGRKDRVEAPTEMAETDFLTARAAADYIRQKPDDPYFLSVGLYNTHRPFPTDDLAVDPDHVQPPAPLPDVPETRRDMAAYATSASFVDDCVGHVLDALRESGEIDETLVIFTTDHGIAFPYMKCNLFEGGISVSLITRFPEGPRGEVNDSLVSQIDLFPTLCEYLELETPNYVEGTSVMPLVRGKTDSIRNEAFSEVTYHGAYEPKRCIRTDQYKYIRRFDEEYETYVLPNVDDSPSKQFLLDHNLADKTRPQEALYDLYHDPNERNNLVDDPDYKGVYEDLSERLDEWMRETSDPLVEGPISKPDGARIHVRDCISSNEDRYEEPDIR